MTRTVAPLAYSVPLSHSTFTYLFVFDNGKMIIKASKMEKQATKWSQITEIVPCTHSLYDIRIVEL